MKNERGLSLLEVMIGLLVMAIVLLGSAAMMASAIQTNVQASHLTEAYQIAQAEVEGLKLLPWSSLSSGSHSRELRGITFTSSWTVLSSVGRVKDVDLVVTWNEGNMGNGAVKEHRIDLRTKMSR